MYSFFQDNISYLKNLVSDSTIKAAVNCQKLVGMGKKNEADDLAVSAMRMELQAGKFLGEVVIGEGEMDEAPMLYIGEKLGKGGEVMFDIAVDPLEGTNLCAQGFANSISTIAIAPKGTLLAAPDVYMEKMAVGSDIPAGILDLDSPLEDVLKNVAKAKGKTLDKMVAVILDRERHKQYINTCRQLGVRVFLITDGDIFGVLSTTCFGNADIYLGSGGAPEGVLAAAALKSFGGQMVGRLQYQNQAERDRAFDMLIKQGINHPNQQLTVSDMVRSDAIFAASGVTDGWLLNSPKNVNGLLCVESLITSYVSGVKNIQKMQTFYDL